MRTGIMGHGGGRERRADEIREGVAMIGHGGGHAEVVIMVGVYSPMCRFWFCFWFWLRFW